MQQEIDWKNFLDSIRHDLNHLYDPAYLRKSLLVTLFCLESQRDAVFKLQELLVQAIEKLNDPGLGRTAPISPDTYRILKNRYVLQVSQVELARQLGMSDRQLRREQNIAIEFLATQLWEKYGLVEHAKESFEQKIQTENDRAISDLTSSDLDWLKSSEEESICNPNLVLVNAVDTIEPLLSQNQTELDLNIEGPLPLVRVHGIVVQQVLLSILTQAISQSNAGQVRLEAAQAGNHVQVKVSYPISPDKQANQSQEAVINLTRQMLQLFLAEIIYQQQDHIQEFIVSFPILRLARVLVVDDNPDFIALLQRFTAGSRYEIYGLKGNDNLSEHILENQPAAIILDIMMPKIDGWELLKTIRNARKTKNIPVIICTILPQENLAIALGATDFLLKPVTQESLQNVLARWVPLQA